MNPKFRAWDKENEKMLEVANISFDKEAYGYDLITVDKTKENPMFWTFTRLEDFILMQSTGLKDKNGIEIYEGDILKCTLSNYFPPVNLKVYQSSSGEWRLIGSDVNAMLDLNCKKTELIGNIHENPELLEVSE